MSDSSAIEWTDATWNPVTGCTKVSQGCDHCYAETFAERWRGISGHHFEQGFDVRLWPDRLTVPLTWRKPRRIFVNSMSDLFHDAVPDDFIASVLAVMASCPQHTFQILTKRPGRMSALLRDVCRCGSGHPPGEHLLSQMAWATSKANPERIEGTSERLVNRNRWPLPNVWLGVSVETDHWASVRIPRLIDTPAAVRFVSAEPLLGPVDLTAWLSCPHDATSGGIDTGRWECDHCRAGLREVDDPAGDHILYGVGGSVRRIRWDQTSPGTSPGRLLDWVIAGGESGHRARPMHPDWARSLRDQCQDAGTAFFFKQWGNWLPAQDCPPPRRTMTAAAINPAGETVEWEDPAAQHMVHLGKKAAGRLLDGRTWDGYPSHLHHAA